MFSKRKRAVIHTLVGDGTRMEGDLHFQGGCHIDGVVHGSVVADADSGAYLSISDDGRVEGSVRVPWVALNGTVEGDVFASEKVELGPTARVVGNVHYRVIEMAAGAEINGQMIHEPPPREPVRQQHKHETDTVPITDALPAKQGG